MPVKEMVDTFVDLGDKLHKNFNQTTSILGGLNTQREQMDQQQSQFDKRFGLESMMARQQYKKNQNDMNWNKSFRDYLQGR